MTQVFTWLRPLVGVELLSNAFKLKLLWKNNLLFSSKRTMVLLNADLCGECNIWLIAKNNKSKHIAVCCQVSGM